MKLIKKNEKLNRNSEQNVQCCYGGKKETRETGKFYYAIMLYIYDTLIFPRAQEFGRANINNCNLIKVSKYQHKI